jgi:hypothetical protein
VIVSEFGVPSAIGLAHYGTLGRNQGGHSEAEAMRMDADMLGLIQDVGLAAGSCSAGPTSGSSSRGTRSPPAPADAGNCGTTRSPTSSTSA